MTMLQPQPRQYVLSIATIITLLLSPQQCSCFTTSRTNLMTNTFKGTSSVSDLHLPTSQWQHGSPHSSKQISLLSSSLPLDENNNNHPTNRNKPKVISKFLLKLEQIRSKLRKHRRKVILSVMMSIALFCGNASENNMLASSGGAAEQHFSQIRQDAQPEMVSQQQQQQPSTTVLVSSRSGKNVATTAASSDSTVLQTDDHATPTEVSSNQQEAATTTTTAAISYRGGATKQMEEPNAIASTASTIQKALADLRVNIAGPKSDTLILLLATALVTPLAQKAKLSPILGFLAAGMLIGPNGLGLIAELHTTETLAELGIVFFLFEMGIELSVERLVSMKKDVFGLGLGQFTITALVLALVGKLFGLPGNALVVLGGGLALSSSAFVLQLLKDKNQLATRFGKASFGTLLFQDLAVVPLLVVTPILAGSGSVGKALGNALIKAGMSFAGIAFAGRVLLNPLYSIVAGAKSQEAFLGVTLLTVLSMSFLTEGLGLSNTLGAFLAGVLLSETKYRYQVEADIAPFRGILLGLFFVTVGFEIDCHLIANNFPVVAGLVTGIMLIKTVITTALSLAFGLSFPNAIQSGLLLSQGGEFAFVTFGLARNLGILDPQLTKLMLTSVSLTMALTPVLSGFGAKMAKKIEEKSDFTHYLGQDQDAIEIKESDTGFVAVVGFGIVGKVVCDLLDRKLMKYVGIENNPKKAIQARNQGLPIFFGDISRPEVCEAFNLSNANAIIITIADPVETNRAVIALRKTYPDKKIIARAKDIGHRDRLMNTLNVTAMVPVLPEDNLLLTLPFGGNVLQNLGVGVNEVSAILEAKRKDVLAKKGLIEGSDFANLDMEEEEVVDVEVKEVKEDDQVDIELEKGDVEGGIKDNDFDLDLTDAMTGLMP
eukprot:CAMPEP_0194368440 /NCGR_PEP_ID=MMETSP0174-20130528/16701_1 /TAXON_ID=216777 /ORGANISM="Proboscia alata, Strain PI-D3" /LENGTH=885 /DNA_ID=CAMNT_0039144829 /DNA_START=290 /DNA_END=2947 /DNA_ORIENTATION=+